MLPLGGTLGIYFGGAILPCMPHAVQNPHLCCRSVHRNCPSGSCFFTVKWMCRVEREVIISVCGFVKQVSGQLVLAQFL